MSKRNYGIIFFQNNMNDALYNFDRVLIVEKGKVVNNDVNKGNILSKDSIINLSLEKPSDLKFIIQGHDLSLNTIYISRSNQYIYFELSEDSYSILRESIMDEATEELTEEEINYKIFEFLYKIGKNTKSVTITRDIRYNAATFSFKGNLNNIVITPEEKEKLEKKFIIPKNQASANASSQKSSSSSQPKPKKEMSKIDISSLNIDEIIAKIKEKMIGQDDAIADVVETLVLNQMLINSGDLDDITVAKSNILIDGPTGTGKTMLMKEISNILSLPIVIVSSTSFSTTGYKGSDLEDILVKLLAAANGDIELAQRGIICLDEFDKLGVRNEKDSLAMRKAVQDDLLSYLSGAKFDVEYNGKTIEFDTSNITFVGLGAFTNLRETKIAEKEKKKNKVGFDVDEPKEEDKTYEITSEDYIQEGIHREIIGRFTTLTYTKALTIADYKKIMLESKTSPLKTLEKLILISGKKLIYNDDVITYIAELTDAMKTGARGLQTIFNPINRALLRQIRSNEIDQIELTKELVESLQSKKVRSY